MEHHNHISTKAVNSFNSFRYPHIRKTSQDSYEEVLKLLSGPPQNAMFLRLHTTENTQNNSSKPNNKAPILVSWKKPYPGWFKINTDACSKGNPGPSSIGGVLRDENGLWVAGFCAFLGKYNSLVAELWAITEGIRLALSKDIKHLCIESDCLVALKLITQELSDENKHVKSFLQDIWHSLSLLKAYELSHVYREGNMAADSLCNYGLTHETQHFEDPPYFLFNILNTDASGCTYKREKS